MFKELGYYKEYYIDNKYVGSIKCEKDRDVIGYSGKKNEVLDLEITLENKKKLKANIEYQTILYPLCGKIQK